MVFTALISAKRADQFLPFWGERPFLPSRQRVVAAAKEMMNGEG
jgi:hypothetical protein